MHFRKEWHRRGALKTSATPPENHSSNLEGSGRGGGFHTSPTFSAARESIAVISGSGSDNATTPEGGNAAESSSPEREGSPSDAATDIWSSGEAPKETSGVPHSAEAPVRTNGTPAGCGVPEGWEPPLGEALTVILRSPLTPPDAVPPRFVPGRAPDRGRGRETPPCLTQRSLLRNSEMVMSPHEEHENHPRKLPQRAECPDTWGSDRNRPEAPEIDRTQKRTGDKTSLKRRDHPCTLLEKSALLVLKHAGGWPPHTPSVTVFTGTVFSFSRETATTAAVL